MLAKKKLFRSLGYEPHAGQWLVHCSTAKRRVVASGARWGKTMAAAYEAIAAALQPAEESRGWIVAPTYQLANHCFHRIQAVVHAYLGHRVIETHERERRLTLLNMAGGTSEIRTKSADRVSSLLGESLDWLVLDEAAKVSEDVWNALSPRLLDRDGWALLISTPRGPGWFHDLYRAGLRGRTPGCESWSAPTRQNPHVPVEVIEEERMRLTPRAFAQEFEGRFLGVEDEPCQRCGNPSLYASGVLIVNDDYEIPRCEECGGIMDHQGRTLVRRIPGYEPLMNLVVLSTCNVPEPELPVGFELEASEPEQPWDVDDYSTMTPEELDEAVARVLAKKPGE